MQVENLDDLLVSLPSLPAVPIMPPESPPSLSSIPTSAAIESLRPEHDPALLSAQTRPLLPAMLGELLTPPLTAPPPASLGLDPQPTPPRTAPPNAASLHEAPTRTKLPVDAISAQPTQASVQALPLATPSVVPIIPPEAVGSGKVAERPTDSIHDKPTAASIPSIDLMSRVAAGPTAGAGSSPPRDHQKLLESNPILRPEPPKESPSPAPRAIDSPDPKLVLPAQVSTAHTTLAPRAVSPKPVHVQKAPEPGLRQLLLKNQEIVAAALGALLVLLIGLLFYALIK